MNQLTNGTKVIKSGYEGILIAEYLPGMYEVKLASGTVVVPSNELTVMCAWCKDKPVKTLDLCASCYGLSA